MDKRLVVVLGILLFLVVGCVDGIEESPGIIVNENYARFVDENKQGFLVTRSPIEINDGPKSDFIPPNMKEGFPVDLSTIPGEGYPGNTYAPVLADVDGEDGLEIVIRGVHNAIVLKGDGSMLEGWPQEFGCYHHTFGGFYAPPLTVGDIDNDGESEILKTGAGWWGVRDDRGNSCEPCAYAWNKDGSVKDGWPITCEGYEEDAYLGMTSTSFVLEDLDKDLHMEAIATYYGQEGIYDPSLLVFDEGGEYFFEGPYDYPEFEGFVPTGTDNGKGTHAVGDVDCDGSEEIVAAIYVEKEGERNVGIYVISKDGELENSFVVTPRSSSRGSNVLLFDLDFDCDLEMGLTMNYLNWAGESNLIVKHHDGGHIWSRYFPYASMVETGFGKNNGDFVFLSTTRPLNPDVDSIFFDEAAGHNLWTFNTREVLTPGGYQPALVDINGDGSLEIFLTSFYQKKIYGFDFEGNNLDSFPIELQDLISSGVSIGDIDNDNILDMVAVDNSAVVYAWDLLDSENKPYSLEWPQFQNNPRHTGNYAEDKCTDGTRYGECSTKKPLQCVEGELISNCQECGCPPGGVCRESGECAITKVLEKINSPGGNGSNQSG